MCLCAYTRWLNVRTVSENWEYGGCCSSFSSFARLTIKVFRMAHQANASEKENHFLMLFFYLDFFFHHIFATDIYLCKCNVPLLFWFVFHLVWMYYAMLLHERQVNKWMWVSLIWRSPLDFHFSLVVHPFLGNSLHSRSCSLSFSFFFLSSLQWGTTQQQANTV